MLSLRKISRVVTGGIALSFLFGGALSGDQPDASEVLEGGDVDVGVLHPDSGVEIDEEKSGPSKLMPDHDYSELEGLVIQEGGRKKPLLSFAKESLLTLSGRSNFEMVEGVRVQPMPFVISLWLSGRDWSEQPLILIDQADVKEALELDVHQRRFSFQEIVSRPVLTELIQETEQVRELEGAEAFSDFQRNIADLGQRLVLFRILQSGEAFRVVPNPTEVEGTWVTVPHGSHFYEGEALAELNMATIRLFATYHGEELDGKNFADASAIFREVQWNLAPEVMPRPSRIQVELLYEHWPVFRYAWIMLLVGTMAMGVTWKFVPRVGMLAGWGVVAGALALLVLGMAARVYISGRAPVTNMYETVIWVAFGLLAFGALFEMRYRCRYFLAGAAGMAAVFLILADSLPAILDPTIAPLTAVLRDNFWLTTHVLTVTISYAAFALAFALGHIALAQQIVLGKRYRDNRALHAYVYRATQVGILLLTIGVVLGGVWANYSWGRFWGWDPKETWSLIAILTYLFVLHGRLVGWWKGWGMTVGAVIGFQSILMCWYGVNFIIGAGLHSYGFGSGGVGYYYGFVAAELLFVSAALFRRAQSRNRPPGGGKKADDAVEERESEPLVAAR